MPWAKRSTKPIPRTSSPTTSLELNDYSSGHNAYVSNDKFPVRDGGSNMWRLAQNARITTLGEYDTRKGFDIHSVAVGETLDTSQIAITGAADKSFSQTTRLAQKFTTGAAGQLVRIDVNIKNAANATGTPIVELWSNVNGAPGALIARSSIDASDVAATYDYETVRFPDAPALTTATIYWIVMYVQATGTNSYSWSSTTNATTALSSSDSGATWASTSYSLNFRQYYATAGGAKGLFRAYKSDGTAVTLLAHGTTLSTVNNVTGALTTIKSGLNASATDYQFKVINDIVYYVNGYDGLRKWDFTTESQVNATNYTHIEHHKGIMFLVRKDEQTRIDYSNFGEYETFTSTDFIYAIGPKTGDPVTALVSLNGYLIIYTANNKIILSGFVLHYHH